MKIIDLSVPISNETPVYPGDPEVRLKPIATVEEDGYKFSEFTMVTHVGTHVDAPSHMIAGAPSLEEIDLSRCIGRGVIIDVREGYDFEAIKLVPLDKGDIVLFLTGNQDHYHDYKAYYEDYKPIPEEVARYLASTEISMIGVDMCSPDHEPFNVHKIFLEAGILIIENLTGLDQLLGTTFDISALPIRITEEAAPARVVAIIKDEI